MWTQVWSASTVVRARVRGGSREHAQRHASHMQRQWCDACVCLTLGTCGSESRRSQGEVPAADVPAVREKCPLSVSGRPAAECCSRAKAVEQDSVVEG